MLSPNPRLHFQPAAVRAAMAACANIISDKSWLRVWHRSAMDVCLRRCFYFYRDAVS